MSLSLYIGFEVTNSNSGDVTLADPNDFGLPLDIPVLV